MSGLVNDPVRGNHIKVSVLSENNASCLNTSIALSKRTVLDILLALLDRLKKLIIMVNKN